MLYFRLGQIEFKKKERCNLTLPVSDFFHSVHYLKFSVTSIRVCKALMMCSTLIPHDARNVTQPGTLTFIKVFKHQHCSSYVHDCGDC